MKTITYEGGGAAWRLGEMCLMWGANASSMWGK